MLSLVIDIYFTLLPWKIVWKLKLKRFEKIGLGIAMSLGFGYVLQQTLLYYEC